jgi:hypothetical protein
LARAKTEIANPLVARGIIDLLFDGLSLKICQIKGNPMSFKTYLLLFFVNAIAASNIYTQN